MRGAELKEKARKSESQKVSGLLSDECGMIRTRNAGGTGNGRWQMADGIIRGVVNTSVTLQVQNMGNTSLVKGYT